MRRAGRAAAASWTHHAPSSKPGRASIRPPGAAAERAGGQELGSQLGGPALRVAPHRQVERGLGLVGCGDGEGGRLAVGGGPALQQPARGVEAGGVLALQEGLALGGDAAEHGVEEGDLAGVAGLGEAHGLGDGGVRRRAEEEELGRTQAEHVGDAVRFRPVAHQRQHGAVDLAQAAQHRW